MIHRRGTERAEAGILFCKNYLLGALRASAVKILGSLTERLKRLEQSERLKPVVNREDNLKILWLTTSDENGYGHTELFGLTKSLIQRGHEVTVIGASNEKPRRDGHIVYMRKSFNSRTLFRIKLAIYLPWLVASNKPDFIIVEWQSAFIPIVLLLLIKLRLYPNNLIHDVRTIPVNDFDSRRLRRFRNCLNVSKRHYLGITTITPALKKKLCSEYNIPPEKVGIWSSGVDADLFYPRGGEAKRKALGLGETFVVFYHGSVGYRRGVVEVVQAMGLLRDNYPDISFFILGSGLEMKTIHDLIADEQLDNVRIHPPVSYSEVPDYIAMADVCVVPLPDIESWRVSSPLKIMEYLAMGKPMILTDIIAHREIIKIQDALFVQNIRPETLAAAIEKAYSMRWELSKMGEAGRRNAREWSWDIQAERLIGYLQSLNQAPKSKTIEDPTKNVRLSGFVLKKPSPHRPSAAQPQPSREEN